MNLNIEFEALRDDAIAETYELFGRRYLTLVLDLAPATHQIEDEINHYKSFLLKDYEHLIEAGEQQKVIKECIKDHDEWMKEVNAIRSDDLGARTNDIAFVGGNETANTYCFELFLAKLNLGVVKAVREGSQNLTENLDINVIDQTSNDGPGLTLREVALIYYYEGTRLYEYNAQEALERFNIAQSPTTRTKLLRHYREVFNGKHEDIQKRKTSVQNLEKILDVVKEPKAVQKILEDLQAAKNHQRWM